MTTESVPKWRRLEPDERKEQIFACAAELFGEQPYADVSTSDIAERAGVARGLINHYFGTKRELYLAVVRRALRIPLTEGHWPATGTFEERTHVAMDRFLDMVMSQGKMWLAAVTPEGIGRDPEVERILDDTDRMAANAILGAVGIPRDAPNREQLNSFVRAFGGMAKSAAREWLVRGSLSRDQVHHLLTNQLLHLIRDVFPLADAAESATGSKAPRR